LNFLRRKAQIPVLNAAPERIIPSARAKRRLGNYFDEFSRGMNPFGLVPAYGVADAAASAAEIAALFDQFNIVKVRGVYSAADSEALHRLCVDASGLRPVDYLKVFKGEARGFTGGSPVLNDRRFWPYAANARVCEIVQRILGTHATEFGSSVAAHYSARGLHRDYRQLCEKAGSAYNIENPQKRIIRVLHYCAAANMQGGMLGVIPFSHDARAFAGVCRRVGVKQPLAWFDTHRDALTKLCQTLDFSLVDEIDRHVVWIATDPGDVLITNSAMLHCGEHMMSPRYFFVSTYTEANEETLPIAAAPVKSETARDYHRHLATLGFGGSRALLEIAEKAAAAVTR